MKLYRFLRQRHKEPNKAYDHPGISHNYRTELKPSAFMASLKT